jgi:hypothetical protein
MATLDKAEVPELDTMAEDGGEECDAKPTECEFRGGAHDAQAHECEFSPEEEIEDPFPVETIPLIISPVDGLPQPIDKPFSPAPGFTRELFVCCEDTRSYVELFSEELWERGWSMTVDGPMDPSILDKLAGLIGLGTARGLWHTPGFTASLPDEPTETGLSVHVREAYDLKGAMCERRVFTEVQSLWGLTFGVMDTGELVPCRAVRERCRFFKRQLLGNDDEADKSKPGGKIGFRNCERRRSVGGAFLSLANEAVFACDYREPPDPVSVERWLDSRDREILNENPHDKLVPLFGLEGDEIPRSMFEKGQAPAVVADGAAEEEPPLCDCPDCGIERLKDVLGPFLVEVAPTPAEPTEAPTPPSPPVAGEKDA